MFTQTKLIAVALSAFVAQSYVNFGFALAQEPRTQEQQPPERSRRIQEAHTDFVRQRAAFRALRQKDETGMVPVAPRFSAIMELNELLKRPQENVMIASVPVGTQDLLADAALAATAGLDPNGKLWHSLGPSNVGGRTRSVVVTSVPHGDSVIWLASAGGGIWKSTDNGKMFKPADDLMSNLAVSCLAVNPKNQNVLYAGTGEGFYNNDALRGSGIFRTLDGVKWEQIPSTGGPEFSFVNRIAISPDGKVLLGAARGTTTDDVANKKPAPPAIYRSDDPDHAKWTRVLEADIADIKFHPADSMRAVAGGLTIGRCYYSIDGGLTWKISNHDSSWGRGRVELAYAVKNPAVVYASVNVHGGELWRSDNGGQTFAKESSNAPNAQPVPYLQEQGWYDNAIWAGDPSNEDLVIVGGIDLWKREKRGSPLVKISDWEEDGSAHSDVHAITSDPLYRSNNTILVGTDGGLFRGNLSQLGSNPKQHPWTKLTNGYAVTQFYAAAANPATDTIIAGAQDNGTLRYTGQQGAANWSTMFGGDGGWCAAEPGQQSTYFYGEYTYLSIHRSSDGGKTAEFISGQADWNEVNQDYNWKQEPFFIPDAKEKAALFIAPFVLDPNNPNRILAGGRSLWQTNDAKTATPGPSWSKLRDPVYDKNGAPSEISAIAIFGGDKNGSNIAWVGHRDGQVYNTDDSVLGINAHWSQVDRDGNGIQVLPQRYCTRIALDPRDHKVAYVSFGGYTKGNIWKTKDFGMSWTNIGASLPAAPINAVIVHPKNSSDIYIGTEVGVFASEDAGANWSPTNEGPTNCAVDDLEWSGDKLLVATHGRGLFSIDLSSVEPEKNNPGATQ